ncbi:MAG TPA: TonB-dependent receptor [Bryobacteraceae bacterium]|nr:TonB-dependent receptor [Bryobacteraceae bacterium]
MTRGRALSLITLLLMCAAAMPAQSSYIYGRVTDPSAAGAAGVSVSVVNEDSGFRYSSVSQSDGAYSAGPLAAGSYKITVRKEGFRTMIRFHVRVDGERPGRADFALSLGSVQETITVEDTEPGTEQDAFTDRTDVAVATRLDHTEIDKLLLDGSGLLGMVELSPGTTVVPATRGDAGQFVADGQRPNTNLFTVDGISANHGVSAGGLPAQITGGSLPVLSAFGSLDSLIPVGSVDQFEIRTSSSSAQFGRLPGAAVSVTSRSGTNEFHGSAGYTFRNELLGANDWFANRGGDPRPAARENNFDGSLGGPLWRGHTFFFLGYEHIDLLEPFTWVEPVPSLDARAAAPAWSQPALALFPIPNGPPLSNGLNGLAAWQGTNSRPGGLDAASLRLDHSIGGSLSLFARFSDSPSTNQFGTTTINHLYFRSWSATAGLNWRIAPELILDVRLNRSDTKASSFWRGASACALQPIAALVFPSSGCGDLVRFDIDGVADVISGNEGNRWQHQWQSTQSLSWKRAAHAFAIGADFLRIQPVRSDANSTASMIAESVASLDDVKSYWKGYSAPVNQSTLVDEFSAWVHDKWRPLPRLTIIGGLRWEYSPPPPMGGTPAFFLDYSRDLVLPEPRPLWLRPYGHFAPRFGISFSPGKATVIRAGVGIYYDSSMSIATDLINGGPLNLAGQFETGRNSPFPTYLNYGFMPNLQLPRVVQWNVSIERSLGAADQISVGYEGSHGYDLIRREVGGPGSDETDWDALTTNNGYSRYNAFVAQYRRRVAHGFEALVSYAWSHSFDNVSSDSFLVWAGSGMTPAGDFASSDYDLRHSLTASFNWALPGLVNRWAKGWGWAKGWSLDGNLRARSGFPITVLDMQQYAGVSFMNAFRPNVVPGVPQWILDANAPGGKSLNPQAFVAPAAGTPGNLGRNAIAGFGMWQLDLALRREFRLADRRNLELRFEAFNALNHPNFADPQRYLDSPYFGQSTSMLNLMLGNGSPASGLAPMLQNGGPRSIEAVIRLHF